MLLHIFFQKKVQPGHRLLTGKTDSSLTKVTIPPKLYSAHPQGVARQDAHSGDKKRGNVNAIFVFELQFSRQGKNTVQWAQVAAR